MTVLSRELTWEDLDPNLTWEDLDPNLTWATWTLDRTGVEVDGVLRVWRNRSLRIDETVDDHSDLTVEILDESLTVDPRRGMPIQVFDAGVKVFSGWVQRVVSREIGSGPGMVHTLAASDHWWLAERRVVAQVWESTSAGDIVRWLVDNRLAEEGVSYTAESVEDGPNVRRWAAVYQPCSEVIEGLADQANYVTYIDPGRVLHFHPRDRFEAPWTLTRDDLEQGFKVDHGGDSYRNRMWVVGGKDTTDPQTETFVGDGERRTFNVGFPVRRQPTIEVNGSPQTVGVRGLDDDSGSDWFFSFESTELTQNDSGAKLSSSDVLTVTYEGVFDFVARLDQDEEVDARRAREGGWTSGLVEKVEAGDFKSRGEAFDVGARSLEKFARPSRVLEGVTLRAGMRAGQVVDVDVDGFGLPAEMLVTRVSVSDRGGGPLEFRVTAVDGPHEGSWRKLFRQLAAPRTDQVLENISESDVVTLLFEYSKDWTHAENPNLFRRLTADGSVQADGTFTANFRPQDRIGWIEWTDLSGTAVLGRRQLTSVQNIDSEEVTSTVVLSAAEGADGGIGELRWFGGRFASAAVGSGVLVATETVDEVKTTQESWQVVRVDREEEGFGP